MTDRILSSKVNKEVFCSLLFKSCKKKTDKLVLLQEKQTNPLRNFLNLLNQPLRRFLLSDLFVEVYFRDTDETFVE